jgi:hydrogenase expression/formation protein HypD
VTTIDQQLTRIRRLWPAARDRCGDRVQLMEICGTHTMTVGRGGLRELLPEGLRLVSGPGCPVCVTDQTYVDAAVTIARDRPDVTLATYGDMVRVPGHLGSLAEARADGADVRVVYSATEAVELARREPERQVIFLAVGFETTAPATALAVRRAREGGLGNFTVFSAHKLVLPAMHALLAAGDVRIDGFLCPGHVSVIIGHRAYGELAAGYGKPCVVAGFDEEQVLAGLAELLRQIAEDDPRSVSVYPPARAEGNPAAREVIDEAFNAADAPWRGLGTIPASGLAVREELAGFDTARRFELPATESYELPGCRCGDVICGRCVPTECPLFATRCTPREPVGPCMVSSEGACAASFRYERR